MNATDVPEPWATVQFGLNMLMCGSRKVEVWHEGRLIGWNVELNCGRFGYRKPKPNPPTVFRILLLNKRLSSLTDTSKWSSENWPYLCCCCCYYDYYYVIIIIITIIQLYSWYKFTEYTKYNQYAILTQFYIINCSNGLSICLIFNKHQTLASPYFVGLPGQDKDSGKHPLQNQPYLYY